MSNEFKPEIIVHNGEGLTLTVRPDEKVFSGSKDDVDYEFKFKDSDVNNSNEVAWKNSQVAREEIKNDVFFGFKTPVITLPLDGTTNWDGIIEYDLGRSDVSNIKTLKVEISSSNNFNGLVKSYDLEKTSNSKTLDSGELMNVFGANVTVYIRLKLVLINNVIIYSSTSRVSTPRIEVKIVDPADGSLFDKEKIKIELKAPTNMIPQLTFKLLVTSSSGYNNETNIINYEDITLDVKTTTLKIGFNANINITVKCLKGSSQLDSDTVSLITISKTQVATVQELADYLNAGGEVWLADTSLIKDMSHFWSLLSVETTNKDLSDMKYWDMSNVTNMYLCFSSQYGKRVFNYDISSWNVSKVTSMQEMFSGCADFNYDISSWDTSSLENMMYMFNSCKSFNQPLNDWNVSKVTTMYGTFSSAESFNQPLNNWNTSKVTNMHRMFNRARSFDQDISMWDVDNVTISTDMFELTPLEYQTYKRPRKSNGQLLG